MKIIIVLISVITLSLGFFIGFSYFDNLSGQFTTPGEATSKVNEPTTSPPDNTAEKNMVTLSFAGDVLLASNVEGLIKREGTNYIFSDVKPLLESSDISMVNLENPISVRGIPVAGKQYTFRAKPESVNALADAGIDIVALANNHILDFGLDAFYDTFDILRDNNILYAGAGNDIENSNAPVYITKKDCTLAFISSSHVIPYVSWTADINKPGVASTYNPSKIKTIIAEARKKADIVSVYVHWGEELSSIPLDYQKNLARMYIDSGASLVIGSHPHVLQGLEMYKSGIIAYSLGNFVFTDLKKETMVLQISLKNKKLEQVKIYPCLIENYRPMLIKDSAQAKILYDKINAISYNVVIDDNGRVKNSN